MTRVWLREEGGRDKMKGGYMAALLSDLRTHWGLEEDAVEFVKSELIRSFRNGLMRGREGRASGKPRENLPPQAGLTHERRSVR